MRNCGRCHECGTPLIKVLDGEEWCPECGEYKRYRSHGWAWGNSSPCPSNKEGRYEESGVGPGS